MRAPPARAGRLRRRCHRRSRNDSALRRRCAWRLPEAVKRSTADYDRALGLIPRDTIDFVVATQPKEWERLKQHHGAEVKDRFLKRLSQEIGRRGALDVLRNGVKDSGCKFRLAYFRPSRGLNEELRRLHAANVFAIVRQLRCSEKTDICLDLAVFLNGVPIFTAELIGWPTSSRPCTTPGTGGSSTRSWSSPTGACWTDSSRRRCASSSRRSEWSRTSTRHRGSSRTRSSPEQHDFRGQLTDYVRLYAFLAQILTFADADLEKLYEFARHLRRLIPSEEARLPREVQQNIGMESYRIQRTSNGKISPERKATELAPIRTTQQHTPAPEEIEPLSRIIAELNERFGLNLGPEHRVTLGQMMARLDGDAALDASARVNTRENVRLAFDHKVEDAIQEIVESNFDLYKRIIAPGSPSRRSSRRAAAQRVRGLKINHWMVDY